MLRDCYCRIRHALSPPKFCFRPALLARWPIAVAWRMSGRSPPRETVAIIVRGHERGALRGDGLRAALVGLLGLVGPRSRVFVRSWAHSDAPAGSTWRASSVEPRIRSSLALEPRRPLSREQLCSYFEGGLLGSRLASCELLC